MTDDIVSRPGAERADDAGTWFERPKPFCSAVVTAQVACEPWQVAAYYSLRRAVFAEEQGLFDVSDLDEHDVYATPLVAVGHMAGVPDEVIGTVRIYPARSGGVWWGGRLCVIPRYRSRRIVGTALICAAVSTAHAWGCETFLATIQAQNVRYFERHRFRTIRPVEVCGAAHHLMEADLSAYPPRAAVAEQPFDGEEAVALLAPRVAA
jgi:putative N-acetyltransferase (TIGR04045 family)